MYGVQLTVAAALLVLFSNYGEEFAEGYALLARVGGQDAASAVTGIALVIVVVTVLLLAVGLYASLHTAEFAVTSPGRAVSVEPGLFGLPDPVFLIPPAVLAWAGYRKARGAGARTLQARLAAGASVVGGYLSLTVVALVPSTWLFDAVAADDRTTTRERRF